MIAVATVGMFVALALATGLLLAFTPYLMRRNECFAVTVPPSAQHDPRLIALKKRYATIMVVVTAVSAIAALVAGVFLIQGSAQSDGKPAAIGIALECAALFIPIVISFALMLRNRRRVVDIKRAEGWTAQAQQAIATIVETDQPQALPLQWNLLYIPVIVGTLAFGLALYPAMPDMLPMHADFAGNVNDWAPKTLGSAIGFPIVFELFMTACFTLCHWMILRSKRPTDPGAPATSALAYGMFARAQSVYLLVVGVLMSGGIGVLFLLSSAGFIGLGQTGVIIMVLCIPVVIGAIALSVVYGQAGSRMFKRIQDEDALLADEDEHWKLGVFYFNPDDASFIVPERFGVGWTMNFARPAAWALMLGIPVLTIAFIVAVSMLV